MGVESKSSDCVNKSTLDVVRYKRSVKRLTAMRTKL